MQRKHFEQFIRDSIQSLPLRTREAMDNLAFVVEDEARQRKSTRSTPRQSSGQAGSLLGLYEGIPKTKRGAGYSGVLPDKITIFQKPLEALSNGNKHKLKQLVSEVVWHEVGHHLGFDEKEIRALEAKSKKSQ